VKVSSSVYVRAFGDEIVLLEFGKGEYFGLDPIGATIWRRIEAGDSLGGIADFVSAHYDVGRAQAIRDIEVLVGELMTHDLVQTP
jgi:hypothetical protein